MSASYKSGPQHILLKAHFNGLGNALGPVCVCVSFDPIFRTLVELHVIKVRFEDLGHWPEFTVIAS